MYFKFGMTPRTLKKSVIASEVRITPDALRLLRKDHLGTKLNHRIIRLRAEDLFDLDDLLDVVEVGDGSVVSCYWDGERLDPRDAPTHNVFYIDTGTRQVVTDWCYQGAAAAVARRINERHCNE